MSSEDTLKKLEILDDIVEKTIEKERVAKKENNIDVDKYGEEAKEKFG